MVCVLCERHERLYTCTTMYVHVYDDVVCSVNECAYTACQSHSWRKLFQAKLRGRVVRRSASNGSPTTTRELEAAFTSGNMHVAEQLLTRIRPVVVRRLRTKFPSFTGRMVAMVSLLHLAGRTKSWNLKLETGIWKFGWNLEFNLFIE